MSKFYDKVLFLIGILCLAGGVAYFMSRSGEVDASLPTALTQAPYGEDFQPLLSPEVDTVTATWEEPVAQSSGELWIYDVFTPPLIFFNAETREFVAEPPLPPAPPQPFGVRLASIERERYRLQLEGYIDAPSGEPEEATLIFSNEETGGFVRGRVGSHVEQFDFEIIGFAVPREDVGGLLRRVPTATILDRRIDKEVELTTFEPLFLDEGVVVTLAGTEGRDPPEFVFQEQGYTFQIGDASYTVQQISFDNQTVTVEKVDPELEEPETRTLRVEEAPPPPAQRDRRRDRTTPTVDPSGGAQQLDDVFQDLFD